jgi:hypothetical protein
MHVHPSGSDGGKHVDATAQLVQGRTPDLLDSTGNGQIERGVPYDAQAVPLQCLADGFPIHSPGGRHRRLEGQVNKAQPQRRHPLDLL